MATLCTMCPRPGDLKCGRCQAISYCSRSCQRLDWALHKLLCTKYTAGFQDSHRPRARVYRGIFFSENEDEPRFVWLTFRRGQGGVWEVADLTNICDPTEFRLHQGVDDSAILKRPVGKRIMDGHHSRQSSDCGWEAYGLSNKSLSDINSEFRELFKGPMLAVGIEFAVARDGDHIPMAPMDLDLVDLRHFIDQHRVLHDIAFRTHRQGVWAQERKGVRVNCKGDQFVFGYPAFEKARIPPFVVIPEAIVEGLHWPQPATWRLGLDLVIIRIPRELSWCNRLVDNGVPAEENWPCVWLTSGFNEPPIRDRRRLEEHPDDRKDQGSFYIGHVDENRELLPQHVQAIVGYLVSKAGAAGHPRDLPGTTAYLNLLSRQEFERYWIQWVWEKAGREEIPSPYDM